jgi:hypothetical protein
VVFHSILFDRPVTAAEIDAAHEPTFFGDLNLDQVLAAMTAGRQEYDLEPFFYLPARDIAAVRYRHEVLQDLENDGVFAAVQRFADRMRRMRKDLAQADKLHYTLEKQRWFLDAVDGYRTAVTGLAYDLAGLELGSRGLGAFRDYLTGYVRSPGFRTLVTDTSSLLSDLGEVEYSVHIRGAGVRVSRYERETDYSADVERTFAKFQQGAVKDYRVSFHAYPDMNHVEARIVELVARLFPDTFSELADYCVRHRDYLDETMRVFDRQVQFYIAYLEYMRPFTATGLPFCYPQVSARSKHIHVADAYDLALATKLISGRPGSTPVSGKVVTNDFEMAPPERIVVVTGPNQGGKTTFARMFGQLHYLASLGLPVPARQARLFLCDRLFTHFERQESLETLRGKLDDELFRVRDILSAATADSVVVMNESFTSTTLEDALFLGTEVMHRLIGLGALAVYVTFVDELATLDESTVSMVTTVDPANPARRTYKIVRKPADGLAYAAAIAEKYGLTAEALRRRIA